MKLSHKIVAYSLCLSGLFSSLLNCSQTKDTSKDDHWDGETYLQNSEAQYEWATSYINKLHLLGSEKILDIGCGDGRISALLAKMVPHGNVIGLDVSESMLKTAEKIRQMSNLDNLTFIQRDASHLKYEGDFDLIVSFSCLHWVTDHAATLKGIECNLKPGGRVFLYFAPDHGRDRFDDAIKTVMNSPKWNSYFSSYPTPFTLVLPSTFTQYAEQAHLLIKRVEIITVDKPYASKASFIAWMKGWMPHLKMLPKELHEEFLNEIADRHLERYPLDNEGKVHYIDYWMEVELLKPELLKSELFKSGHLKLQK